MNHVLSVRLGDHEYHSLKKISSSQGKTLSASLRSILNDFSERKDHSTTISVLLLELYSLFRDYACLAESIDPATLPDDETRSLLFQIVDRQEAVLDQLLSYRNRL